MRNLANSVLTTVLTLFLLTLLPNCSGYYPIEGEHDMPKSRKKFNLMYEDPFEERARGQNKPTSTATLPVPPRLGPWSGNNQLGISQDFAPTTNNRQTILKLDEWGMPEVWTVMLGLEYDEDGVAPGTSLLDVKAVVTLGSGGSSQNVEIDWNNGVVFSAPMNAIDVVARYDQAVNVDDIGLRLTVNLGQGDLAGLPPTYTPPSITVGAGATSAFIDIPSFAMEVFIANISNGYTAGVFYDIVELNSFTLAGSYEGNQLTQLKNIPLNNRSRFLRIRNTTGGSIAACPIFKLGL